MSFQDILKEILDQAQREVVQIKADMEAQKQTLKQESELAHQSDLEALDAKTQKALEAVESKMGQMARRENARHLAQKRKALVDGALNSLVKHLSGLSDERYKGFLSREIEKLSGEKGTLLVPEKRLKVAQSLVSQDQTVKGDASVSTGFRFEAQNFVVDGTFENLVLSQYRNELEIYFAEQLKLT